MAAVEASAGEGSFQPRAHPAQACDNCRASKIKCVPSFNTPGICQKCERSELTCVWVERRPRKVKRVTADLSKTRIAALEAKLEELSAQVNLGRGRGGDDDEDDDADADADVDGEVDALLAKGRHVYPSPSASSEGVKRRPPNSNDETRSNAEYWVGQLDNANPADAWGSPGHVNVGASSESVRLPAGLSFVEADKLLDNFRSMSLYFPFVVLPSDATASTLCQTRPNLLLAVLTVASTASNRSLQDQLEKLLRRVLLEKIMLNGEKTLDLLSGILVYIAWYHFFFVPRSRQIGQLMHLAISLCYELGLDKTPAAASAALWTSAHVDHYEKAERGLDGPHDDFFSREARRLYLGCYYMSGSFAWHTGRSSPIDYTEYLKACATSLAQEGEYPTDEAIPHLLELQRLADKYHRTLSVIRLSRLPIDRISSLHREIEEAQEKLEAFRNALPPILQQSTFIELSCHVASFHVHEMDLINPFVDQTLVESSLSDLHLSGPLPSTTFSADHAPSNSSSTTPRTIPISLLRQDIIIRCLHATNSFFATFLSIPSCEYASLSTVLWFSLIYATVILYKLSIGIRSIPDWDIEIARKVAPILVYLERLDGRMAEVEREMEMTGEGGQEGEGKGQGRKDLFSLMRPIWASVADTYKRLSALSQDDSAWDDAVVHPLTFPHPAKDQGQGDTITAERAGLGPGAARSTTGAQNDALSSNAAVGAGAAGRRDQPNTPTASISSPATKRKRKWEHPCPAYPFWKQQKTSGTV